ncbi:Helix-turn-helix domain-containing protein [Saccharopolyspora antimicrobica]|uniref:Helix-turn-helix domain-containing protein n=1 Tax=Saccharopolyspora antimicrobica TaxID=455193 RepID=A0A1I4XHD8_9PSEU|nr:helix-turn-helix transcriptional regulator [Saccharopolyspora antimicrobica]RKT84514.1 helix-turn-helix protein [Saccharopolyspora antimicrobica]SFN25328.1 Helix-turn-helix domain-containing protein [Saccharopolyspora antimicrobica]
MVSPTLRRKTLGAELRRLRIERGASIEEIAKLLGCSSGKVSHFETGRNAPSKAELIVLMGHYKVPADQQEVLEETREEARKRGWWSTYRLPPWFQDYVGMEADAIRVRTFELELIPGLLQTESYARAINVIGSHMTEPSEVDRKVAARLRRQQRLNDQDPLELHAVVSEAALYRCADPAIAVDQLTRLIEASERPNITIQILPFSAGFHESVSGSFALLDFPPDTWPSSAYQEYAVGGHLVDDTGAVTALGTVFERLRTRALDEQQSKELIAQHRGK